MASFQKSEPFYDVMQVCLNGHKISGNYYTSPQHRQRYCTACSAKTIYKCPNCKEEIKGEYHNPGSRIIFLNKAQAPVPKICEFCGQDFPWRERLEKIRSAGKPGSTANDQIFLLNQLCDRFHLVAIQLRKRREGRNTLDVQDEYDVQDLFHSLLHIYFDDIRPEEHNPSLAGASTRSDFLLKKEKIVVEVKKTRSGLRARDVGEQLIIDIAKYKGHPDCKTLYCFVYDPDGYIANPRGVENDLKSDDPDFRVIVSIVPKGS